MQRIVIAAIGAITLAAVNGAPAGADQPLWEALEPAVTPAALPLAMIEPAPRHFHLVKPYAAGTAPFDARLEDDNGTVAFGESEINSLGCIVGGATGLGAALAIGGINVSNLIAGGLVPAANPAALYASLFGVVFATFCAVGQAVTPFAVYTYRRYMDEARLPPAPMVRRSPEPPAAPSALRRTIAETR
jgi:hypothetical protein